MKAEQHQEIYRVAYEAATSELTGISEEFERLRLRKEQVERLLGALKPLAFAEEERVPFTVTSEDPTAEPAGTAKPSDTAPEPVKAGADPFQRRIDHVLGIGAGIRDVRSFTRQF